MQRIGQLEQVNADWGYAIAMLDVDDIPPGSFLYFERAPGDYLPVQLQRRGGTRRVVLSGLDKQALPTGAALLASPVQAPEPVAVAPGPQ
jgi:hypothetical protein